MTSDINTFTPIPFNPRDYAKEHYENCPEFRKAWEESEEEFYLLSELLKARRMAGLTQAELAVRMGKNASSIARIEGSLGNQKHTPSLATLRAYAKACGKRLELHLVDIDTSSEAR